MEVGEPVKIFGVYESRSLKANVSTGALMSSKWRQKQLLRVIAALRGGIS